MTIQIIIYYRKRQSALHSVERNNYTKGLKINKESPYIEKENDKL